ncbi:methylosome subunit pICln [Chelonus insularis]|uniref:methylosome subunit pICln n=1 Tax=Chelonus insularis TaxID=460826 RepID=UPI00158A581D|nr:methylosome subunit pICln [Chelonus insularis]XP_034935873.1 methylosome subunit pICln [Chelonus insularis]XP_034935874.1 methylosome subunit pICln [Chelonus insularis]
MVVLSNFFAPQEGIKHEEQNTTVFINDREVGKGTLYITESVLSWVNNTTQQGFSLEYPHISLHAVSRDEQVHPRQCLYVMVDAKVDLPGVEVVEQNEENSSDDNADSETVMTEMRFAPDNTNNLDAMFQAMNHCQALHPDPQDNSSDDEHEIFEDAEEDDFKYYEVGAEDAPYILPQEHVAGNQNGNDNEDAMDVESGMFEDAEEGI